jgi:hypothetical protein
MKILKGNERPGPSNWHVTARLWIELRPRAQVPTYERSEVEVDDVPVSEKTYWRSVLPRFPHLER